MMKLMMAGAAAALAFPLMMSPASARDLTADGVTILPVAYEAMRSGQTEMAVEQLQSETQLSQRDPSRLINLGSAYARLGQKEQAAAMYRAAMASPIRYDVELADGQYMDSRWAARTALERLQGHLRGTVTIARAD
jgi:Flp pilus assembly protein TadD